MYAKKLTPLALDEQKAIGYTYKCLGAAFWALKQSDFRKALEKICMKVQIAVNVTQYNSNPVQDKMIFQEGIVDFLILFSPGQVNFRHFLVLIQKITLV